MEQYNGAIKLRNRGEQYNEAIQWSNAMDQIQRSSTRQQYNGQYNGKIKRSNTM